MLAELRDESGADGDRYRIELDRLSTALDPHLSPRDLDFIIDAWTRFGYFPLPSVVLHSGRAGAARARRRDPLTIALVARSLALYATDTSGTMTKAEADDITVGEALDAGTLESASPGLLAAHRRHLARDSAAALRES